MTAINKIEYRQVQTVVATAFLCVALAVGAVWPMPAHAQTTTTNVAELQALINQIIARLNALQGQTTTGVCPYTWTRSLGQGSTGADVMRLQQFLNTSADTRLAVSGAGSPGMETQYYGPITAAAVSRFHVKYRSEILTPIGLVNPTGYFGPMSRAKANQLCSTVVVTPPGDDDDDILRGGAGYLDDVQLMGGISNEDVGEGQNDVDVLGLEMEAQGSDVALTALTLDFDQVSHSGNFNRYADEVSIWLDGEEIARVDADEFTRSNSYRRTLTLDSGAIIRQGDVGELVVAVSGASNIDSTRIDDQWTVEIDSVRFRDAQGAFITDTQMNGLDRTITFVEFSSAVGLEVKVRSGDYSINRARTIEVSATRDTDDEDVLSFTVEVEGDTDVLIDELLINATSTGNTINNIVSVASLYMDGDRVGTESINSTSTTITFDDLDLELRGGRTYEFIVAVDLNEADGSNYSSGATIDFDVLSSNVDDWYIEDENGDLVSSSDKSGSVSGDVKTLRTGGANLDLVSSNTREVANPNSTASNYGEFRMVIDITAIGETIYVPETAIRSATASSTNGLTYSFEDSSGSTYSAGTATHSFTRVSGGTYESGFVRINEGQTARFELVATLDPAAAGQYRAQLESIGFNDTAATPDSTISATPEIDFRSSLVFINN